MLHGAASFQHERDTDEGLAHLVPCQAHGVIIGAVRRALRTFRNMTARKFRFIVHAMVRHYPAFFPGRPIIGPSFRPFRCHSGASASMTRNGRR